MTTVRHDAAQRRVRLGLLALCLSVAFAGATTTPAGAEYRTRGEYLTFADVVWPSRFQPQADGSVLVDYGSFSAVNPTTTAQYGLYRFSRWVRDDDPSALRDARRAGGWLVRSQRGDGGWGNDFPWQVGDIETLPAGWLSSLAQGQAMSLLVRLHLVTRARRYLRAARRALRPFTVPVEDGGVRTWAYGGPWFEEYPTRAYPSLVLNGSMFALLGLHDLAGLDRDAGRLFDVGLPVVEDALPAYDLADGWSLYSPRPLQGAQWPAPVSYQRWHVRLLRALDSIRPDRRLRHYADRWARALREAQA